jgi:hypothetical protein
MIQGFQENEIETITIVISSNTIVNVTSLEYQNATMRTGAGKHCYNEFRGYVNQLGSFSFFGSSIAAAAAKIISK